jgi:hypothetical protein
MTRTNGTHELRGLVATATTIYIHRLQSVQKSASGPVSESPGLLIARLGEVHEHLGASIEVLRRELLPENGRLRVLGPENGGE